MVDETTATTADENSEEKSFGLDDVKRVYYAPTDLDKAQAYVNQVAAIEGVKIKRNFDIEKPLPEGFGLGVIPISRRVDGKNVVSGVAVCAIPDISLVVNHEKGQPFVREVVTDHFMAKAANAFRPRPDGSVAGSVPESLEDFITSLRGKESLKTFTEIAGVYVKALKKKGIKFMTPLLLRQTLQSEAFAAGQFEKISQDSWVSLLNSMIKTAEGQELDTSILKHWLETRSEKQAIDIDDDVIGNVLEGLEETEDDESATDNA